MATFDYSTDIPIDITVGDAHVTGRITYLSSSDIMVVIDSDGTGRKNGTHVPHFAMYPMNRLSTWIDDRITITARGRQRATALLLELFENAGLTEVNGTRVEG
jgi:hypothetical protein